MDNRLVLFVNRQCKVCERVMEIIKEIDPSVVDFRINWVMPARGGMYQIVGKLENEGEKPILISKSQLPAVPAIYDSVTQELVFGMDGIGKYLLDSGLIDEDSI